MTDLRQISEAIEKEIAILREKVNARKWSELSRDGFVYTIVDILPRLEELNELFTEIDSEIDKSEESSRPEVKEILKDINTLIILLQRNKEMEQSRIKKIKQQNLQGIAETITVPELYADLEQKTLSLLLKCTYIVERIRVFQRKRMPIMNTKAAQRNVLDILEKREDELQSLKKKYDETRKHSFLGMVEKNTANEIEHELNALARKLETQTSLAKKAFESNKIAFQHFERQMMETQELVYGIEELEAQSIGKTFELITMLKKERDYVKKVLIEIEQETIKLRNSYSKELLNIQEEKIAMRNDLEEKYERKITGMRKEIRQNMELLTHFKDTISKKEEKIVELTEKNEKLEIIAHTLKKHGAIKEKFLKEKKKTTPKNSKTEKKSTANTKKKIPKKNKSK